MTPRVLINAFMLLAGVAHSQAPAPEAPEPQMPRRYLNALSTPRHPHPVDTADYARATRWFVTHPDAAVRVLAKAYDERRRARRRITYVLGLLKRDDTLPLLSKALRDQSSSVSWTAGRGLAIHPSVKAAQILIDQLHNATGEESWHTAIFWLSKRGDKAHCKLITSFLSDPDGTHRYYALQSGDRLGCISEAHLKAARMDPYPSVKTLALELLQKGTRPAQGE